MGRCQISIVPYRDRQTCEESKGDLGPGPWSIEALDGPGWSADPSASTDPQGATPWGNQAAQEALASSVSRNDEGNFASASQAIRAPDEGTFGGNVTLTFDDGPNVETTPIVLDVLKRHGIQATFFIHGERLDVDGAEELVARMRDEGHLVANHAERHQNFRSQPAAAGPSVSATHDRLDFYQGDDPRYFRFPGGNAAASSIGAVEEQGYAVTGWHVDSADWCYAEPAGGVGVCDPSTFGHVADEHRTSMADNVLAQTRQFDGGIILFHDDRAYTAEQLEEVIEALQQADFTFTNLDDPEVYPVLNGWAANLTPAE